MSSAHAVVRRSIGAITCMALLGCGDGTTPPVELPPPVLSESARQYLNQVIDILRDNSVRRHLINWDEVRETAMRTADGAQTPAHTFPAVRLVFERLGMTYNVIVTTDNRSVFSPEVACNGFNWIIPASQLPTNVGYIKVQDFVGDEAAGLVYATNLQDSIRVSDREGLAGWIVDLRGATGLDHWPMLAGVGPILGDGVVGSFVEQDGSTQTWEYQQGAALANSVEYVRVSNPYTLRVKNPRVAVLMDRGTAISGEALAIAFQKRPNTRFIGFGSCGLSHTIKSFTLIDGSTLFVASGTMADRASTQYYEGLDPDEYLTDHGSIQARAIDWVQGK